MSKYKIVLTGGGSGGHITPILAVAKELKSLSPDSAIIYIGQKGDELSDLPKNDSNIDKVYSVRAGKYRRYHGDGIKQFFDIPTIAKNLRDIVYIFVGLLQSWRLMRKLRPDIIFSRGGYVSVPVAWGGKLCNIPYITHDSDSTPSLANRIIARGAKLHAVALPEDLYPYPRDKTITVGVPIGSEYQPVDHAKQQDFKRQIDMPSDSKVLLVTGGGNGAQQLNSSVVAAAKQLLINYPKLHIIHFSGRKLEQQVRQGYEQVLERKDIDRVLVKGYATDHYRYSGAADIILARGGATSLAEIAAQGKACIVIPSPQLIWNVKNAQTLEDMHAIVMLQEKPSSQANELVAEVSKLLDDDSLRLHLASKISSLAKPDSASKLADLILNSIKKTK
jgi:UDP-N-acetylglucosamine--N-acetylmuramyl-(pentapeptide) pyrophosphoryl-undecaprenol N-acetylglucosamine transferase